MRYGRDKEIGPHPNIRKEVRRNYKADERVARFLTGHKSMRKNELKEKRRGAMLPASFCTCKIRRDRVRK
jgi:hypothetical protein